MRRHILAALLAGSSVLVPLTTTATIGHAQEVAAPIELPAVTQEQVLAACTAADATVDSCKAVVAAYFTYLESTGVVGADLQTAIATLVVALAEADVAPELQDVVVAAIETVATYADPEQAAAILEIAQTIEEGGVVDTAALGSSPA